MFCVGRELVSLPFYDGVDHHSSLDEFGTWDSTQLPDSLFRLATSLIKLVAHPVGFPKIFHILRRRYKSYDSQWLLLPRICILTYLAPPCQLP